MPKSLISAGAARFAHLLGRSGPAAAPPQAGATADSDDEMKQGEGESDDDYAKRKADKKTADEKAVAAKNKTDDEEDDDDDAESDDKETKKAHDAGFGRSVRAARRTERRRCAAIFTAPAAANNVALAASLAFETDLTVKAAVAVLENAPAQRATLADRMAAAPQPRIQPGGPARPTGDAAIAAAWDVATAAFKPKN